MEGKEMGVAPRIYDTPKITHQFKQELPDRAQHRMTLFTYPEIISRSPAIIKPRQTIATNIREGGDYNIFIDCRNLVANGGKRRQT